MSSYIKLATLEYPRHEGDIRLEHPEITEDQTGPTFPCPDSYAQVIEVPAPIITDTQYVTEEPPIYENGVWKRAWSIHEMTEQQIIERDKVRSLLSKSQTE